MAENKGEPTKNIQHQHNKDTQQDQEASEPGNFISSTTPLYISTCPPSSQQFIDQTVHPKRQKYTPGQWKLLPSPQQQQSIQMNILSKETTSTLSPSRHPTTTTSTNPPLTTASSSDTAASTPPHDSPRPSQSPASTGQELAISTTPKIEGEKLLHQLSRKGKFVSPVWKPNEMLWLARGWRAQYQGGFVISPSHEGIIIGEGGSGRGKTRADKDREVSEFLNKHGIQRDAKTAGTKWDNMLGEFRKVYEYERGGEREQYGKSYFRLSPYDRKIRRLPASFDEEVFDELCQFMGPRMRGSSHQGGSRLGGGGTSSSALITTTTPPGDGDESPSGGFIATTARSLPPPPIFKEDEYPYPGRGKQLATLGFEGTSSSIDIGGGGGGGGGRASSTLISSSSPKELHRIGKIRMIWEESVNLWGEEGEYERGRIKHEGLSLLNADEIAFFDDSMVSCTMETFEDGPYKGFSVDRFVLGQQVKVIGRRKSSSPLTPPPGGSNIERVSLASLPEASIRTISQLDYQDPGDYYLRCLRVPPSALPTLFELSWHLQDPPPDDFRFPLRRDVYKDLPQGKELFFTPSHSELLDSRSIIYDIIAPIIRTNPSLTASTATSRDSFISLWDDSINRVVSKFCSNEMVFVRKPGHSELSSSFQDQWPHLTGFLKGFCLWRGEETDHIREGVIDPASSIIEKILWSYMDLPYILGYYAIGYIVTFCALSRSENASRIIRTDIYTIDLSTPSERLKALVPCWRISGLLTLLAEKCYNYGGIGGDGNICYSDFERIDMGSGNIIEMTPNFVNKLFPSKRKWAGVKEIYEFLGQRIPNAEYLVSSNEKDLMLVFKPRVCRFKPINFDQLIEALKIVTKALVALHDLSFMHRDLSWDKVLPRVGDGGDNNNDNNEWVVTGFDVAVSSPQIYPHGGGGGAAEGLHAPEMVRGLHHVKVDVYGIGKLIKTSGLTGLPPLLRELQNRCLDPNPEQRPTAADCYRHMLQLQSMMSASTGGGASY